MTQSPHGPPSVPDTAPAAAAPGGDLEPADGAGEHVDPDVLPDDDGADEASDITDAVRDRPEPPFRTPDTR